jgi:MFS family permease
MCLGISFASFGSYAVSAWIIDFFVRAHPGLDFPNLLITLGIINGTAYASGVWAGGVLVDKFSLRNKKSYGLVPAILLLLGVPAFYLALQVESLNVSLALMTVLLFTSGSYLGPSFALAQTLAPIKVRAMSTALFFFVLNIIALGGGPTFVGILSNAISTEYGEVEALRISLSWLVVPYVMAILAFYWTSTRVDKDWQVAAKRNS